MIPVGYEHLTGLDNSDYLRFSSYRAVWLCGSGSGFPGAVLVVASPDQPRQHLLGRREE